MSVVRSSAPFSMALIIERLVAQVPDLRSVEGSSAYAAITSLREFQADSAYVLLARERGDGEAPKAGRQRAMSTFGVVLAVKNYRSGTGEAIDDISPLIAQTRAALMGWTPDANGARPCQWLDGAVLDFDQDTLLWSDVYQTQHFIGGTP